VCIWSSPEKLAPACIIDWEELKISAILANNFTGKSVTMSDEMTMSKNPQTKNYMHGKYT
jgi:hypothetical protein